MKNLLTLTEYADLVMENRNDPHFLADLTLELGVKYSIMSEKYKPLKLKKAEHWQRKYVVKDGEKPLSDKYLETQWDASKEGLEESRIKIELDGLAKLMSAIKSYLVQSSIEAKNLN